MKSLIFICLSFILANVSVSQSRLVGAKPIAPHAKALIYIYLDGGAAQTDTFDPKPSAGRDYYGKYPNPIKTNVDGVIIGEKLPRLAMMADKYSLIRSMTHGISAHETGHYAMQTGDMTGSSLVYPSFCSMLSYLKQGQYIGNLFSYITLTAASTRFNEAGFLPSQYKAFDTGGAPEAASFNVDGVVNEQVTNDELKAKRELLTSVVQSGGRVAGTKEVADLHELRDKNYKLILGNDRQIFNLKLESDSVRLRYGMTRFGQSCLTARRLVQSGVPIVMVRFTGWDTHKEHFARMDERLKDLDDGLSALLTDLERLGLLDQTIVMCGGEFGRTPRIMWEPPWNGGRGHYGKTFSYLVAGGGFMGGVVVGQTDAKGENVTSRPVFPCDLIGSIYTLMGIDPYAKVVHPRLGAIPLLPSLGGEKSGGILYELIKK